MFYKSLSKAVEKFPQWPDGIIHAATVVTEESGELAQAALQTVYEPEKSTIALDETDQQMILDLARRLKERGSDKS